MTALRLKVVYASQHSHFSMSALIVDVFDHEASIEVHHCVGAYILVDLDHRPETLHIVTTTFLNHCLGR